MTRVIVVIILLLISCSGKIQSGEIQSIIQKPVATTYYVSPSGSDSDSGSVSAPFRTIQKAANIVNPGDTVIVKDGTYTDTNGDDKIVSLNRGGAVSNWITFRSENKWGAVLDCQNDAQYGWMLDANADYIRIEGFEVKNARSIDIYLNGGVMNIYIYGNKIHDTARRQITCSARDVSIGHPCIYSSPTSSTFTFDSNVIYNCGRLPGGCELHDYNKDHGLYMAGTIGTIINNIFYDNKAGWSVLIGSTPSDHWNIINNTFYGANPGRHGHVILVGAIDDVNIQNNISHSPEDHFVQSSTPTNETNITIKNNLVYGAVVMSVSGSGYTLSNNIVGQDPKFVDLSGRDFHLQADSPAIDKGEDMYVPKTDFDKNSRPKGRGCDIGAYEFDPELEINTKLR